MSRLAVPKTYKLFVAGAFRRSESGRTYPVVDARGTFAANVPAASRKDLRDAVQASRRAFPAWSGTTAYNRGQVLYRIAEVMEGRRAQFADEVRRTSGVGRARAEEEVDAAIDLWVWYAGWSDKLVQVAGGANPVAGPFFNLSVTEPTGVAAIVAPQESGLVGLVSVVAPALVAGNTVVAMAARRHPFAAVGLAEVLATSDVPCGTVNILTGDPGELMPVAAAHADVNALDLTGAGALEWVDAQIAAAETLKRVLTPVPGPATRSLQRILAFTETKTIWHTTSTR
ncbi:MAG TPA: aldehyde dehydrogenase family protein [Microbacteriaceae bacterium]|nr:aldehyde dehydrogenase family protein [Microbacteriaceae bacterium]